MIDLNKFKKGSWLEFDVFNSIIYDFETDEKVHNFRFEFDEKLEDSVLIIDGEKFTYEDVEKSHMNKLHKQWVLLQLEKTTQEHEENQHNFQRHDPMDDFKNLKENY